MCHVLLAKPGWPRTHSVQKSCCTCEQKTQRPGLVTGSLQGSVTLWKIQSFHTGIAVRCSRPQWNGMLLGGSACGFPLGRRPREQWRRPQQTQVKLQLRLHCAQAVCCRPQPERHLSSKQYLPAKSQHGDSLASPCWWRLTDMLLRVKQVIAQNRRVSLTFLVVYTCSR